MRKRSGAIDSDSAENFVKLAKLTQNVSDFFYSNAYKNVEFLCNNRFNITEDDFSEQNEFMEESLPRNRVMARSISYDLEEEYEVKTYNVMVVGDLGLDTFISYLFGEKNTIERKSSLDMKRHMDLLIKQVVKPDRTKVVYKFWIQNTQNQAFDDITKVYYGLVDVFLFIYDSSQKDTFLKLDYYHKSARNVLQTKSVNGILVGINFVDAMLFKSVDTEEGRKFAEDRDLGFVELENIETDDMNRSQEFRDLFFKNSTKIFA